LYKVTARVAKVGLRADGEDHPGDTEALHALMDRFPASFAGLDHNEGTILPVIAARLLGLSEKTVRAWAAQGVLTVAHRTPRLLLDLRSVHVISHLVRDLRELGKDRDLLDEVWRRLSDTALLERPDLQESIQQMRRGEGRVLRPLRENGAIGS
jgi:DNA-binding transcriptional MerR regulator